MNDHGRPRSGRGRFPHNPSRHEAGRARARRPLDRPRRTALEALRDIDRGDAYANLA